MSHNMWSRCNRVLARLPGSIRSSISALCSLTCTRRLISSRDSKAALQSLKGNTASMDAALRLQIPQGGPPEDVVVVRVVGAGGGLQAPH